MTAHDCVDGVLACRNLRTIESATASSLLATSEARRTVNDHSRRWTEALVVAADVGAVLQAWKGTSSTWGAQSGVLNPTEWDDLSVSVMEDARRTFAEQAAGHVQMLVGDATDYLRERLKSAVDGIPGLQWVDVVVEAESPIPVDFMFGWEELAKSGGGIAKGLLMRGVLGPGLAGGASGGAAAMGAMARVGALRATLGLAAAGPSAVGAVYEWTRLKNRLRNEVVREITSESDRLGMHLRGAVNDAAARTIDLLAGPLLAQLNTRDKHFELALDIAREKHAFAA